VQTDWLLDMLTASKLNVFIAAARGLTKISERIICRRHISTMEVVVERILAANGVQPRKQAQLTCHMVTSRLMLMERRRK